MFVYITANIKVNFFIIINRFRFFNFYIIYKKFYNVKN